METSRNLARAVLKLALFITFAFLLAKPFGVLMLSFWDRRTEPSIVEAVSRLIGIASQFSIMYIGMLISFFITRKLRRVRLIQVLTGFSVMAGAYYLSVHALRTIIAWAAVLVGGMMALGFVVLIGAIALYVFLWTVLGPWSVILLMSDRDE